MRKVGVQKVRAIVSVSDTSFQYVLARLAHTYQLNVEREIQRPRITYRLTYQTFPIALMYLEPVSGGMTGVWINSHLVDDRDIRKITTHHPDFPASALADALVDLPMVFVRSFDPACPACSERTPTDVLFQQYYRDRQSGKKVSLRAVAERSGYAYSYIRKLKAAYDQRAAANREMLRIIKNRSDSMVVLSATQDAPDSSGDKTG